MTSKSKIVSIGFLILVLVTLLVLSVTIERNEIITYKEIVLSGNQYQTSEQYSKFANLAQCVEQGLPLQIIKNRIEKHPYVKTADVIYEDGSKVTVNVIEKEFIAILINKNKQFILTNEFEALPVIGKVHNSNYPLVCNLDLQEPTGNKMLLAGNNDLRTAYKILKGIEILNPEMFSKISEIDLCRGKNTVLYFNNFDYPVIIGKENEVRKIVSLNKLWTHLNGNKVNNLIKYINLQFNDLIYLGMYDDYTEDKGKKS